MCCGMDIQPVQQQVVNAQGGIVVSQTANKVAKNNQSSQAQQFNASVAAITDSQLLQKASMMLPGGGR